MDNGRRTTEWAINRVVSTLLFILIVILAGFAAEKEAWGLFLPITLLVVAWLLNGYFYRLRMRCMWVAVKEVYQYPTHERLAVSIRGVRYKKVSDLDNRTYLHNGWKVIGFASGPGTAYYVTYEDGTCVQVAAWEKIEVIR